jgi:mannosyltransferase OCH1-like enzyme
LILIITILLVVFILVLSTFLPLENFGNCNKLYLFQTYKEKKLIPRKVYNNISKYAPNYQHIIYDDDDCQRFIQSKYGSSGLDTWKTLKEPAHKADFWRYCILYEYGGIYLDIKTELVKPLDEIFQDRQLMYSVTCTDRPNHCIYNGILCTPPKNPFFLDLIYHCIKNKKQMIISSLLITSQSLSKKIVKTRSRLLIIH